jgi:hypothetical protein
MRGASLALSLFTALELLAGCSGPLTGALGRLRGRTNLLREAEESPPPPLPPGKLEEVRLFPLLFKERTERREVLELAWPLFEEGRSSESAYLALRPLFSSSRFRDREALVVFPFWWRIRERRETGERSVDHLWPLYGVHRRDIDLAPTVTRHFLCPIFSVRTGGGRWKARLFPLADLSSGFLDRGWWLLPLLKAGNGRGGAAGGNRFFYLLDPLFAFERFSIALGRAEGPEDTRTEVKLLGGLLGWERSGGRSRLRLFWLRL